jgi:DNA-nicking Smr family endonuclease
MGRRRTLRPDEQEIWHAVARTANPLHGHAFIFEKAVEQPAAVFDAPLPKKPITGFRLGEKAQAKGTAAFAVQATATLRMDAKTHGKMTRGKLAPEARIDLHGMTMAEAQPELIRFILNAQNAGLRLVLVITGKGKQRPDFGPIPQPMGILRHNVPLWLRQMPLAPAVLQVTESHLKHGGAGALYVYLRRG